MTAIKSKAAYEHIKEMILSGELPPSSDISEKQLQEQLGFSRTPIHEAIKRLESEQFVKTHPRKGTFVTDVTMESIQDSYTARLLIEPYMTANAVRTVPEEWLQSLYKALTDIPPELSEEDVYKYLMSFDTKLHTGIAAFSDNYFLRTFTQNIYEHDRRIRLKTILFPKQILFSQKEHIRIVEALLNKDAEAAEAYAREHIIHSRDLTYWSLGFTTSLDENLKQLVSSAP